jgi:hypothetical protein
MQMFGEYQSVNIKNLTQGLLWNPPLILLQSIAFFEFIKINEEMSKQMQTRMKKT